MQMVAPVGVLPWMRYFVSTPFAWREVQTSSPKGSRPTMPTKQTLLPRAAALAAKMAVELPSVTIMSLQNFSLPISGSDSMPFRMMSTLSSPMAAMSYFFMLCGFLLCEDRKRIRKYFILFRFPYKKSISFCFV